MVFGAGIEVHVAASMTLFTAAGHRLQQLCRRMLWSLRRALTFNDERLLVSSNSYGTSNRKTHRRKSHGEYFGSRQDIDLVVTEHVDDYRAAVNALVLPSDVALEVGCAGGKTTCALARVARVAYGVDKSLAPGMREEQRSHATAQANLHFEAIDATDIGALKQLSQAAASEARAWPTEDGNSANTTPSGFSVILVDISGSAKLSTVLDVVERYEACFQPSLRLVIVKSFRFACLLDRARPFEASS